STTHGAEVHSLAAALATMRFYAENDVTEALHRSGERLRQRIMEGVRTLGLERNFQVLGRACNLVYATRGADGKPNDELRTLFLQETLSRGLLIPSLVVSYSHSDADIDQAADIVLAALEVYRSALRDGVQKYLRGRPVKPSMRSRA